MSVTPAGASLAKNIAFAKGAIIGSAASMIMANQLLQNQAAESEDSSGTNGFGNYGSTYPADTEAEKEQKGGEDEES